MTFEDTFIVIIFFTGSSKNRYKYQMYIGNANEILLNLMNF